MIGKVLLACLLCVVLATCAKGRRWSCRDSSSGSSSRSSRPPRSLEGLLRRSAALASSLRNLRSVRQRRWSSSLPIWKSIHKMQERAMDTSGLPPLPVHDAPEVARDFDETHAVVEKDLQAVDPWRLDGIIEEDGFWGNKPFEFPGLSPRDEATGGEAESELSEDWAPPDLPIIPDETIWGDYIEQCSDDIVGNPCIHNNDCPGCRVVYHCSTSTNRCVAGEEPDPRFDGFF